MKKLLTLAALLPLALSTYAGGYQVNAQGQREIALGHAGVGLTPSLSSVFFNPGALAHYRQNGVQLGVSGIISNISYQMPGTQFTAETDNPVKTPFQVYAAYGAEESDLKFGLGVYTPFGSTVEYPDDWVGQYALTSLSLQAIFIQPTVSYRINDMIGVGAGFVYMTGSVNLQRQLPITAQDGSRSSVELDGSASGYGFNAGVYIKPTEELNIGVSYRSKVTAKVEGGDATFTVPASARGSFQATQFDAQLPLISTLSIGASYLVANKLLVSVEYDSYNWSEYEALTFEYDAPVGGSMSTVSARNYENSSAYRLGLEYLATEDLKIRAGAYYDGTPIQDGYFTPETPSNNRIGISGGLGYTFSEKLTIDASYLFITEEQVEQHTPAPNTGTIPGFWKAQVHIPGIAITYHF